MKIKLESGTCISICLEQKSKIQLCVMCLTLSYVPSMPKVKAKVLWLMAMMTMFLTSATTTTQVLEGARREERNYILPNSTPKTRACSYWCWWWGGSFTTPLYIYTLPKSE